MSVFYFVRHGESEANAAGILATPDVKLTATGIEQARKTGQDLKQIGITKIVCSPMLRTQQTAETIASELGMPLDHVEVIEELRERSMGQLEGKPRTHEPLWYILMDEERSAESTDDLLARMSKCYQKLKALSKDDTILAVGHGASGYYLLQIAQGKTKVADFDPPSLMLNAEFIKVEV